MNLVGTSNPTIPIIGQATIAEYFLTLLVKCPCGHHFQLVGLVGSMRVCPGVQDKSCNRIYRLDATPVATKAGTISSAPIIVNQDGGFSVSLAVGFASDDAPV